MRNEASSQSKAKASTAIDVIGIIGVASTSAGAGLIYMPAGFITFGVLMIAVAVLAGRNTKSGGA